MRKGYVKGKNEVERGVEDIHSSSFTTQSD
jgi:hypothetical protein